MENLSKKQQKRLSRLEKRDKQSANDKGSRQTKSALTWLITIVVIIGVVWGLVQLVRNSSGGGDATVATSETITENDWTIGNPDAPIQLIEYSDLQCPACASYEPILEQLLEEYAGDIYFAYRHFPLKSIHPHAQLAAQATEAAGLQGKFWEMKDLIFENQPSWSVRPRIKDILVEFAGDLDLDLGKFEEDLESSGAKSAVDGDNASAFALRLNSTPTFILNGNRISNPAGLEQAREMFDAILAKTDNAETSEE
jgi:protein-disulfide isomerase